MALNDWCEVLRYRSRSQEGQKQATTSPVLRKLWKRRGQHAIQPCAIQVKASYMQRIAPTKTPAKRHAIYSVGSGNRKQKKKSRKQRRRLCDGQQQFSKNYFLLANAEKQTRTKAADSVQEIERQGNTVTANQQITYNRKVQGRKKK